ncbi:MAG: YebC/PmpR family DNA-binding transcriptional regulator [Candidatus Eremiobacteraeota bacterium]|nr:YebC/PmpR family DNA-binding transcriptional regulator [Candidatus Eremiobacteraeota bacterium]
MSGHSKWHNIRLRKGRADAQRGALFTKLAKEIVLALRSGSADPEANYRLKMAIEKARENNMPHDNIKRLLSRASGAEGAKEIEEMRYEGYGPGGIAVIVDAATDNRNRTASEMRFIFSRHGGSLGETNTVAWMFESSGVIEVDPAGRSEDDLTENALIDGVVDVEYDEPATIYTQPEALHSVRAALEQHGLRVLQAYLGMRPKTKVTPAEDQATESLALLDALEDHEDVQRLFSNAEFSDAALALAASS